jgi:hypothetical protein
MNATAWYYVGLLVLLVVLCVGISVLPLKQEGFGDVGAYYAMGTDLNSRMQKGATDGIFTNNDYPLDPNGINRALNTPDLYNTTTIPNDYSTIFTTDPAGMYTDAEKNFCRGATDPRNLPATNNQKVRCGWLYVDDPGRQSMGAIGTWNGPLFPENSPAGSVWYWDLAAAAKRLRNAQAKLLANRAKSRVLVEPLKKVNIGRRAGANFQISPGSKRVKILNPETGRMVYANGPAISLQYLKNLATRRGVNIKGIRAKNAIARKIFS